MFAITETFPSRKFVVTSLPTEDGFEGEWMPPHRE
jgi:hypothetical protein